MQMLAVYCHLMIPLVVKSILIQVGFTINYTEEFLLIVQWIATWIAEICFYYMCYASAKNKAIFA